MAVVFVYVIISLFLCKCDCSVIIYNIPISKKNQVNIFFKLWELLNYCIVIQFAVF